MNALPSTGIYDMDSMTLMCCEIVRQSFIALDIRTNFYLQLCIQRTQTIYFEFHDLLTSGDMHLRV